MLQSCVHLWWSLAFLSSTGRLLPLPGIPGPQRQMQLPKTRQTLTSWAGQAQGNDTRKKAPEGSPWSPEPPGGRGIAYSLLPLKCEALSVPSLSLCPRSALPMPQEDLSLLTVTTV